MMPTLPKNVFGNKQLKVIRHAGQLNQVEVELESGRKVQVKREESIFILDIGMIKCCPYDNHFVFRQRMSDRGWTLFCTCGSPAAIYNYDAYGYGASNTGAQICCMAHVGQVPGIPQGQHADGSH